MSVGLENIFQKHVSQEDIALFMGALVPIFLVYVGVFAFLLMSICFTALKNLRNSTKAKNNLGRVSLDDDDDLLARTDSVELLKKPKLFKQQNICLRDSAHNAFFEVVKGEDLNEFNNSLCKTNGDLSQQSEDSFQKIPVAVEDPDKSFTQSLTSVNLSIEVSSIGSRHFGYTFSTPGDTSLESEDLKTNCLIPDTLFAVQDKVPVIFQGNTKVGILRQSIPYPPTYSWIEV